jgi:hypothetical protein
MTTNKSPWSILGWTFGGLSIVALLGIALLVVLLEEIAEQGWVLPNVALSYFPILNAWQESTGNEFSGDATALLFGLSILPVAIDLISRGTIRYVPVGEKVKGFIRGANNQQRKYLMPFHTYLSMLALGFGILHLNLSSCIANPFPEWGLILSGVLVVSGLLFKWKAIPTKFRKTLYQFHTSLIVSGVLLAILLVGHMIMSID